MYALNLGADGRVLSALYAEYAVPGMPIVDTLPEGDIGDYLYQNRTYVYDPIVTPLPTPIPSELDRVSAQATYTAMMTDTLLEE